MRICAIREANMKVKRISFIGSGRDAPFIAEALEKAKSDIELLA